MKTITLKTATRFAGFAGLFLFALMMMMSLTTQPVIAQDRATGVGGTKKAAKAGKKRASKKRNTAKQDDELSPRPKVGKAVKFDISPPLRSMIPILTVDEEKGDDERGDPGPINDTRHDLDPVVQQSAGYGVFSSQLEVPGTNANFEGLFNTTGVNPPDPNGDIGLNHYVQMVNSRFQIFSRTGTSVYGPANINTLFAGFGGACQNENAGDPVVVYDQIADRWLLSQFTAAGPTYFNCVAISTTGDPTGTYYRYAFSTGSNFPDYPKYGVWSDAYFISTREFAGGSSFAGVGAYALNRAQMLAGNPSPQVVSFIFAPGSQAFRVGDGLLPADLDGTLLPPAGSPHYFLGSMDAGAFYGAPADALNLFKFNVNWAVPANSTFTFANQIDIAAFDTIYPCPTGGRSCIPQPGTTTGIDILSYRQRPTFRLAYRNFGSHESLVTTQSVEATLGVAGMRWWEIRSPNSNPVIYQEGTYAPDSVNRWMGSVAMDNNGNMALGYSVSDGATVFPGIRYTGRLITDPLGMLPQGEGTIINGGGVQTGGGNRWGDYTSMSVDPIDDCTFWYTNEYYATTSASSWRTRIASFKFPNCTNNPIKLNGISIVSESNSPANNTPDPGETVTISVALRNSGSTASNNVTATLQNSGGITPVAPVTQDYGVIPAGGVVTRNFTFSVPANAVRGSVVTLTFQAQDGATNYTFTQTYTLGNSIIVNNGVNIVSESNLPANNTPDPGETVTVSLALQNTGNLVSNAVTATLQNSGGITPAAPTTQNYGNLPAGGVVTRNFTFQVPANAVCGSQIILTFQVQDGAVTQTFTKIYGLGIFSVTNSENFDGVTAPALPAGWTSTQSGIGTGWTTSTTTPASAPNAAFAGNPNNVGLSNLESPVWNVTTSAARLDFKINYNTERNFDGAVLEMKIGAGAYQDIIAAGGSFVTGGYSGTLNTGFSNPLPGRAAWTGNSGGYISALVNLPAAANGQSVQFRWRIGSDDSAGGVGVRLDDVQLFGANVCSTPPPPIVTLTVNKTADTNDGVCNAADCSLREALDVADSGGAIDTIIFNIPANSAGCVGTNCTITLSSPLAPLADGGLLTTIDGATGANVITLSGNGTTQILNVGSGVNLAADNLNFTRGGGNGNGGAISNSGTLTLANSALYNNSANLGGAIYTLSGSQLALTNVTVSGNSVGSSLGGGIYNSNGAAITATNCTITKNTAQFEGGVLNGSSATFTIRNTIIADNTASFSPDAQGNFTSQGYNLIGNASGANGFNQPGDQTGLNAQLGTLANNGGKTQTQALLTGSPAIDKGSSFGVSTDQRGFTRPFDNPSINNAPSGDGADIGAFEVQAAPTAASVSLSGRVIVGKRGLTNAFVTLTDSSGNARTARTSSFGYYRFDEVEVGQTYIISVQSRRFQFAPQVVSVNEELSEFNFYSVGEGLP